MLLVDYSFHIPFNSHLLFLLLLLSNAERNIHDLEDETVRAVYYLIITFLCGVPHLADYLYIFLFHSIQYTVPERIEPDTFLL